MKQNEIQMRMEQTRQQIETHAIAAYTLLPDNLVPYSIHDIETELKWLREKFEAKEWRQIFYMLQGFQTQNAFSVELCQHIEELHKLFNLYDSLGVANVLNAFTDDEKRVVGECLQASAYGPFFDDCEVHTLFGAYRDEIIQLAKTWPTVKSIDSQTAAIINNSFNNLLGYPHRKEKDWPQYISISPEELHVLFRKFKLLMTMASNDPNSKAQYFNNMM